MAWIKLDPITRLSKTLLDAREISASDLDAMHARADAVADDAARFAEESPNPPLESLTHHVYKEPGDA